MHLLTGQTTAQKPIFVRDEEQTLFRSISYPLDTAIAQGTPAYKSLNVAE